MRILHLSDLHGRHDETANRLIAELAPDWIVLTGDIPPDFREAGGRPIRLACQEDWWRTHAGAFSRPGAVTTFTLGNHELEGFRPRNHETVPPQLVGRVAVLTGVPAEFGAWGFSRELDEAGLRLEAEGVPDATVVLSHCPPYGWLDRNAAGESIGHRPLREGLEFGVTPPLLVLCGHVHESFGQIRKGRTLVVNAATGFALIDLDLHRGVAMVDRMARFMDS